MARIAIDFLTALLIGTLFWTTLLFVWTTSADELPERPQGYTVISPKGQVECFPENELRKIVLWVKTAERLHKANSDLLYLLETTRAELTVVGQDSARFESLYKSSKDEIIRLQLLVIEQQRSYTKEERMRKLRAGVTWGSVSILTITAVVLGVGWGTAQ